MISLLEQKKDPEGVGLSAIQVGIPQRICIVRVGKRFVPFINPEIVEKSSDQVAFFEGCLSVPNYYGTVYRPSKIKIRAQNKRGKIIEKEYRGLLARIFQHEIDHMNGVLFIDHIHTQKQKLYKFLGKDERGRDKFAEVVLA